MLTLTASPTLVSFYGVSAYLLFHMHGLLLRAAWDLFRADHIRVAQKSLLAAVPGFRSRVSYIFTFFDAVENAERALLVWTYNLKDYNRRDKTFASFNVSVVR